MKRVFASLAMLGLLTSGAQAVDTLTVTAGSGTTFALTNDGSGHEISIGVICGGLSASFTTSCATQMIVTAAGAAKVDGSAVTQPVSLVSLPALATGGNVIGAVTQSAGPWTVSLSSLPALATGGNVIGAVTQSAGPWTVSGTVQPGNTPNTTPWLVTIGSYPTGATPITASATGTVAATTATLTNVTGHTTYICGFSIRANATAAATGNATVTGTISGTLNFTEWTAPQASGLGVAEEAFVPCVPASGISTNISVISAASGTGGVVSVTAWGYSI